MTPERVKESFEDDEDYADCVYCGGEGYIYAVDGDGSDWGEDTYAGPLDAVIPCRHCAAIRALKLPEE